MTSYPVKKLVSGLGLEILSRLLVKMIITGGKANWKMPKTVRLVSFLLPNFKNGK